MMINVLIDDDLRQMGVRENFHTTNLCLRPNSRIMVRMEGIMKKKLINTLLLTVVITIMMFTTTACSSKDDDLQDARANTVSSVATQQEATETAESTNTNVQDTDIQASNATEVEKLTVEVGDAEGAMTLEEWTKSDECIQFSEMMNEGLDGMTISFEVDNDIISMIFTMTEAIDIVEDAEETMNEYFASNAAIFEAIRDQLIDETGNQNTVLRLVYRNADDSDIFSMDF